MSELASALRTIARLPSNVLIFNPAGTYCYVGRVDHRLAHYHRDRGGHLTEKEARDVASFGPDLFSWCGTRTWKTREEAIGAARELGIEVQA